MTHQQTHGLGKGITKPEARKFKTYAEFVRARDLRRKAAREGLRRMAA